MQVAQFQCPQCRTRLRIRQRRVDGHRVECPECQQMLELSLEDREVIALAVATPPKVAAKNRAARMKAAEEQDEENTRRAAASGAQAAWLSPQRIAWAVAGLIAICFFGYMLSGGDEASAESTKKPIVAAAPDKKDDKPKPQAPTEYEGPPNKAADPNNANEAANPNEALASIDADPPPDEPEAMADNVVGNDPNKKPNQNDPAVANADPNKAGPVNPADVEPVEHPQPPPKPPVDFDKALGQKILAYEIPEPVAVGELLVELSELAGIPIRFAESVPQDQRAIPVSVSLNQTTVGEILDGVLAEAKLKRIRVADALEIQTAKEEIQ